MNADQNSLKAYLCVLYKTRELNLKSHNVTLDFELISTESEADAILFTEGSPVSKFYQSQQLLGPQKIVRPPGYEGAGSRMKDLTTQCIHSGKFRLSLYFLKDQAPQLE